jgi:hypothetical protein
LGYTEFYSPHILSESPHMKSFSEDLIYFRGIFFIFGCTSFVNRMGFQNFGRLEICPGWSHASRIRQGWLSEPAMRRPRGGARKREENVRGNIRCLLKSDGGLGDPALPNGGTPSPPSARPQQTPRSPKVSRRLAKRRSYNIS